MGDQRGGSRALMEAAGVLNDLPYRIEWSEFAAAPLLEALNADSIDAGVVGDAPFTFAAVRQRQEGLAIVVPGASPIRTPTDLKGKTIGIGKGSVGHALVLAILKRAGLTADDVDLVFLLPADARPALVNGSIDAWSTWEPYTSLLEIVDGDRRVADGVGVTPGLSFQAARPEAIRDKRAAVADYVARLAAARRWSLGHIDAYARSWSRLMKQPAEVARRWFTRSQIHMAPIDDGVVADERRVANLYTEAGVLPFAFDAETAFDRSFTPVLVPEN